MTTPGGVPNLPAGALTEETLAEKLQDMSAAAMRSRARERMPSIFDDSTGGNILSDLTPFGLLTRIWAEVNSLIANADPADIQGPQDIPQLLLDFIQGLPVIGELVGLLEAILGEYAGDDEVLLAIQQIFAPIRKLVQLVAGQDVGFPTIEDVTSGWTALADALENVPGLGQIVGLVRSFGAALLGAVPVGIITDDTPSMLVEGGYDVPDTIHPDSDFQWRDEGVPGTTPLGSAWVDADGADHSDATEIMPVGADWELEIGTHVKWTSLAATAGQNAIRLNVIPYVDPQTPHPSGAVMVASVESPSGDSSSDKDGWVEIVGTWSPPEGVTHFAVEKHVTSAATAGSVGFDETYVKATQKLPQKYTHNLPEDLTSLWNGLGSLVDQILIRLGITPVGSLLDRIFDLSDELEWIQEKAQEGALGAAQAIQDVVDLAQRLLTDPASVIGTIPQSLVSGLQSALTGVNDWVQSLIDAIVSALRRIPIVGGTLADIVEDIGDLLDFVDETALEGQHTRESIVGGYRRSPAPGATTVDVENVMTDISTDIVVAQDSAITLANLANAPKNVPFWVSPDPFEDVAFPRAMLTPRQSINVGIGPTGSVWSGSAGSTAHTHSNPSPTVTTDYVIPAVTGADGDQYFNAIRTTYNRIYNTIGFITSGGTPPATVYAALYRIDPETGEATMEYDFGNVSAHILTGSGLVDQRLTMDHDIIANEGDLWAVSILPVGGSLGFGAIRRSDMGYTGIYPRYATARLTGRTFMPVSVAGDDFVSSNFRVWACLGQAHEEDTSPVTLVETFNAADTADWRSNNWNRWVSHDSYRLGIKGGRLYLDNGAAIAALTVAGSALHRTLLHTSDHACEITIGSGWDAAAYGHATTRAYVRCRSNGSGGVAMHLDNDGTQTRLRIATISTMTEVGTVRATVTGLNAAVGDRFRIQAEGSTYRCFRNDEPIPGAVWEDTAGIIPQTPAFRAVGCGVGNRRAILLGPIAESAYIDHWRAYDL